jgi:predicted O-linked N-acetylglucosamine transferase (SPINDLY family)
MSTAPSPPPGIQHALAAALEDHRAGRLAQAEAAYRQVLAADPNAFDALHLLGSLLVAAGRNDDAIAAFERAVTLRPDAADTWSNLGFCLVTKRELHRGESACRRAIELNPKLANAHANLGNALQRQARIEEATAALRAALSLNPNLRVAHQNLLVALNYLPAYTPQDVYAEHVGWAAQHANHLGNDAPPHANDRDENRRLRVGYVSPDFRRHSVAFFIEPLLAAHDRGQVEVVCYSDVERPDETTARIKQLAEVWRDTRGLADDRFAQIVRDDRIDILIDLAGHTPGNRLLAFARRPAPVQMTYLGYPNTTGMAAIDYRITDAHADPPGVTDAFHSEQLIRLPRTAWCYHPPAEAPPVATAPPSASAGQVTFASFNKLAKISPPCADAWAQLLRTVPASRMIVKSTALGDAILRQRLLEQFAARGVAADRLEILGPAAATADHLAVYARADVALDTFPYHGTTTTCDALHMGVPVVTLAGQTHVQRVGVSLLHAVGLDDLVAETPEAYVEIAARLSGDCQRLAELRSGLRGRLYASPLGDGRGLAREMESAFRQCWRRWCGGGGAGAAGA